MNYLAFGLVGFCIGAIGALLNWSMIRTLITATVVGAILSAVTVKADEVSLPIKKLRETTLRTVNGTASLVQGKSGKVYILTNFHVCLHARHHGGIVGARPDGVTLFGPIVKISPSADLCAAELKEKPASLKPAKTLLPLEPIYTRGYPQGVLSESTGDSRKGYETWSYRFDIADIGKCPKAYKEEYDDHDLLSGCIATFNSLRTSLYALPGSSGSPVVNSNGDLVGVISSWLGTDKYDAGMVDLNDVQEFLKGL